jgi:Glyoxalase-like domain
VIELDHVLVAVDDLTAGAQAIEEKFGLSSYEGGRHPGWGTANRIVPLASAYIELIAVVDQAEARGSAFGRWVLSRRGPLGWAVRGNVDAVAQRLGLPVAEGSRQTADGRTLRWRFAGTERAMAAPCFPFFIEWAPGTTPPGDGGTARLTRLDLRGDEQRLADWLGEHRVPIAVTRGAPGVTGFVVQR